MIVRPKQDVPPIRPCAAKAYIARPITDIATDSHTRMLVECWVGQIEEACARADLQAYDPDRYSGVTTAPDMSPVEVYQLDLSRVCDADALIALCTPTSNGVAMEIQLAGQLGRPVLIIHPTTWLGRPFQLSRMLRGCAARVVATVAFTDPRKELPTILDDALPRLREAIDAVVPYKLSSAAAGLASRMGSARHALKIDEEEFAAMLGVSVDHVRLLEGRSAGGRVSPVGNLENQVAPPLAVLRRAAEVLQCPLGWLLEGESPAPTSPLSRDQMAVPTVRQSWLNLLSAARQEEASHNDVNRVWRDFETEWAAAAAAPQPAGELLGNRDAWTVDDFRFRLRDRRQATLFD